MLCYYQNNIKAQYILSNYLRYIDDCKKGKAFCKADRVGVDKLVKDAFKYNMCYEEKDAINLKRASEGFRIKCQPRLYEDSLLGKNSHPLNYLIGIEKRIRLNNIGIDERKMNSSFILSHFLVTGMSNDSLVLVLVSISSQYW